MNQNELLELGWSLADIDDIERVDKEKSRPDMGKLKFFSEHPELADPVIWFLPERRLKGRGGQ